MATSHSGIVKEAPKHSWDLLALRREDMQIENTTKGARS